MLKSSLELHKQQVLIWQARREINMELKRFVRNDRNVSCVALTVSVVSSVGIVDLKE